MEWWPVRQYEVKKVFWAFFFKPVTYLYRICYCLLIIGKTKHYSYNRLIQSRNTVLNNLLLYLRLVISFWSSHNKNVRRREKTFTIIFVISAGFNFSSQNNIFWTSVFFIVPLAFLHSPRTPLPYQSDFKPEGLHEVKSINWINQVRKWRIITLQRRLVTEEKHFSSLFGSYNQIHSKCLSWKKKNQSPIIES